MGLLGQMVFLNIDPWRITTLSSTMVELIYIPTNSVKAFLFLHILSTIHISRFFVNHHFKWHEMLSQCGFDMHFFNHQWWWAFFHRFVCWPNKCLFLKSVCSYPVLTFWRGCFILVNLCFLYILVQPSCTSPLLDG